MVGSGAVVLEVQERGDGEGDGRRRGNGPPAS